MERSSYSITSWALSSFHIIFTQRLFTIKMGFQIDLRNSLCPFAAGLLETLKKNIVDV